MWNDATGLLSCESVKEGSAASSSLQPMFEINVAREGTSRKVKWDGHSRSAWCGCTEYTNLSICAHILAVVRYNSDLKVFVEFHNERKVLLKKVVKPTSTKKGSKPSVKRWTADRRASTNATIRHGRTDTSEVEEIDVDEVPKTGLSISQTNCSWLRNFVISGRK